MESGKKLKNRYCCVIPVFNNSDTVEDVVRRALAVIDNVLIIDDGSTDANLPEKFAAYPVEVIRHKRNLGKGAALITALKTLDARNIDYMITLDGDGQHFPEDIPGIIELLESESAPVLLSGVRDFSAENVPAASCWGRRLSNYFINLETGAGVLDSQCGFRAYPVGVVSAIPCRARRYDLESEIMLECALRGIEIVNQPIKTYYPPADERISHYRKFLDSCRIIKVHCRLLFKRFFCK